MLVRRLSTSTLLQRNATSSDVAAMVCALLAPDGATGQTVVVDGGRLV